MGKVKTMNKLSKALIGTVAAGAMALTSASPAMARERDEHRGGGISAGDVLAGGLILGGIAVVASAASHHDRDYRPGDYRYDDYRYSGYDQRYDGRNGYNAMNPRDAVQQCVYAAQASANRVSYGGRAQVIDIRSVDRKSDGYKVKGRIAVNTMGRDWRAGDRTYGNGWGNDYRGWNDRDRGYDSGTFTCQVRYGRVVDLDFDGIRGLR